MAMRRRLLLLAALLAAVVPMLGAAPPASAYFNPLCTWTPTGSGPVDPLGPNDGLITAGPYLVVGASSVDVTCELRYDSPSGTVVFSDTQNTAGQAGVYATGRVFPYLSVIRSMYLCTYVKGQPSGARIAHGCQFAFTSR